MKSLETLEAAVRAVNDQISAFNTFGLVENPHLAVLILNIKSIIENELKPKKSESISLENACSDELGESKLSSAVEDAVQDRIKNCHSILNCVELQINAFQHFPHNNNLLSTFCDKVQEILQNVKTEANQDSLAVDIINEDDETASSIIINEPKINENVSEQLCTETSDSKSDTTRLTRKRGRPRRDSKLDHDDTRKDENEKMKPLNKNEAQKVGAAVALTLVKKKGRPPSKRRFRESRTKQAEIDETMIRNHDPTDQQPVYPNPLHLELDTQFIEIHGKDKKFAETNVETIASPDAEANSDWTISDMFNLLKHIIAEETEDEITLIEKVFSDPVNLLELQNRLTKDINGLVLIMNYGKPQVKSVSALPTSSTSIPSVQNFEAATESSLQPQEDDAVIIFEKFGKSDQDLLRKNVDCGVVPVVPVPVASRTNDQTQRKTEFESDTVHETTEDLQYARSPKQESGSSLAMPKTQRQIFVRLYVPITDLELWTHFARFGLVEDVQTHMHPVPSKDSVGYCFVTFCDLEATRESLKYPEQVIFGKQVHITKVKGKGMRPFMKGRSSDNNRTSPRKGSTSSFKSVSKSSVSFEFSSSYKSRYRSKISSHSRVGRGRGRGFSAPHNWRHPFRPFAHGRLDRVRKIGASS